MNDLSIDLAPPADPAPADTAPSADTGSDKPHLSASQVSTYLMCPRRWAYCYVRGMRAPSSGAATQGKAWHAALEHGYLEAQAGRPLPSVEELQDVFETDFTERLDVGLAEPEGAREAVRLGYGETREGLLAEGLALVRAHRLEIAPQIVDRHKILHVEREIKLSLGEAFPFALLGYIDLITEDRDGVWIRDNKSRSKKRGVPKQSDVDSDLQLTFYALLWRATTQTIEHGLTLDCVVKQGGDPPVKPKTKIRETFRMNRDIVWLLGLLEHMARAIYAESYPPCAPEGAWFCSPKWCDYWSPCMGDQPTWPAAGERHPRLPALPV